MAHQTARLPDETTVTPAEKEEDRRHVSPQENQVAPRAGRTGGAGVRAERPSEGTARKGGSSTPPQTGRGGKAPSASDKDTKKSRDAEPQAARDASA